MVILALVVAVALAAILAVHRLHRGKCHALFAGPSRENTEHRVGYYPQVAYDLTGYLPDWDNASNGERATPGILDEQDEEAKRRPDATHPDAISVAAKLKWLKLPTIYRARWVPRFLTVTYPPRGAVFPANLCSPFVEWRDIHNDLWQVTLSVPHAKLEWRFVTDSRRWRIPRQTARSSSFTTPPTWPRKRPLPG